MPNKAMAAAGSTGLAGALTVLIVALFWPKADATVVAALQTVVGSALAFATTYFVPHNGTQPPAQGS